jgi:hypothetical protein
VALLATLVLTGPRRPGTLLSLVSVARAEGRATLLVVAEVATLGEARVAVALAPGSTASLVGVVAMVVLGWS